MHAQHCCSSKTRIRASHLARQEEDGANEETGGAATKGHSFDVIINPQGLYRINGRVPDELQSVTGSKLVSFHRLDPKTAGMQAGAADACMTASAA